MLRRFWYIPLIGLSFAYHQFPDSVRDAAQGPLTVIGGLVALSYAVVAVRRSTPIRADLPSGIRVVVGCLPVLGLLLTASGVADTLGADRLASDLRGVLVGVTLCMVGCGAIGVLQLKRMARIQA